MSSIAEMKEAAEKLGKEIADAKKAAAENGGRLDNIERRMAGFEAAQQRLTQTIDAFNRSSFERSHSGRDRELDAYNRAADDEVKAFSQHYLKNERGVVRLVGHDRIGDPNDPAHSRYKVYGLFDDPNPRTDWQRRAQQLLDRRNLVQAVLNAGRQEGAPRRRAWRCEAELIDHMRAGPEPIAKIFADSSGIGAAWIPDNPMPELERELLFRPSTWQIYPQVQMTRNPLLRPYKSGYIRAYKGQIPTTDDPAADPLLGGFAPSNQVIQAEEVAIGAQIHLNAEEDAIISFDSEIRTDLIDGSVFAIENAIINGDSAATHQDAIASWDTRGRLNGTTGLGGSNDQRRLWLGLRALAYDLTSMTTDGGGAAITAAHILADLNKVKVESLLGSEGRRGVIIQVSPESFFGYLVGLAEFDAFDNVGVLASVLTGQLGDLSRTPGGLLPGQVGFLYGRFPLIVNYCITKDLAATGLYTGSGSTTGMLVNDVSRFQMFVLRGGMVRVAEDIRNNTRTLVSRARMKFQPKDDVSSTNKTVHWRYNTT